MPRGTIKALRHDRGFGFITGSDGGEFFFHVSDVAGGPYFDDLRPGQAVTFKAEADVRGPRAREVVAKGSA